MTRFINGTGGWTIYGAGIISEEAREAIDQASRSSIVMAELHDAASQAIGAAFGSEAAFVTNCAAAALAIASAALLVQNAGADGRALPWAAPARRRIILPKGHALNFSAEITQMLRLSGAEPVELGAVNSCTSAIVEEACSQAEVVGALYVQSPDTYPHGTISISEFVDICRSQNVPVIIDAAGQPLINPIVESGADIVIASAHKFMGGPTAGIILSSAPFIGVCRSLEANFARPFKSCKEDIAGVMAAATAWAERGAAVVNDLWETRAEYAGQRLAGIPGIVVRPFHYASPLQGVHARIFVDQVVTGINARELARQLLHGEPRIAVVEEEAHNGVLILHFAMLDENDIDQIAEAIQRSLAA